ncbi:MAG: aldehyde dehydrogenase family protein [Methanomassiliicoccales archaeon]|nr:aldehyde dehydrogenase family protein [Methanomassiliicoccales archaeon]
MPFANESTWSRFASQHGEGELNARYEKAVDALVEVLSDKPKVHVNFIGEEKRTADEQFKVASPVDSSVTIGTYPRGSAKDASDAVEAAAGAFATWRRTDLTERLRITRRAAEIIRRERFELAALLTMTNGKVRREAVGEVDMAIDYLEYYSQEMERNDGYNREMPGPSPHEKARNVFLPYGPWAVVCPFNFPFGISMGMLTGVLLTGNTAVIKPASPSPAPVYAIYDVLIRAGVPPGALNLVAGTGAEVGEALVGHPKVEGVIFTGSREVGYGILGHNAGRRYPIPVILELGGKNAAIISSKADLVRAVRGVVSSAFGYSGQKCVACSRAYVHKGVYDDFLRLLVQETEAFKVMDPRLRDARTGPVIHEAAVKSYERSASMARKDGRVLTGGRRLTQEGMAKGCFVAPTVAVDLPDDHELVRNELFLPFLTVMSYERLDDAVARANSVPYGLTAGIYSEDASEADRFLENVQCGMVFVNGVRGATNGAITGIHSFGGWKGSGSTGRGSGDIHYLLQFMREQGRALAR